MTTSARAKAAAPTENDLAIAEGILERLGGALSLYGIFVIRAASVWHYKQWELAAERDGGLDSDWQKVPVLDGEQKRAITTVDMPARLPTYRLTRTCVKLDPGPVQDQLDRAEVAAGYLYTLHGVAADGEAASFMSEGEEPLGPSAIIMLWNRIAQNNPELKLTDDESVWTSASLKKDDSRA